MSQHNTTAHVDDIDGRHGQGYRKSARLRNMLSSNPEMTFGESVGFTPSEQDLESGAEVQERSSSSTSVSVPLLAMIEPGSMTKVDRGGTSNRADRCSPLPSRRLKRRCVVSLDEDDDEDDDVFQSPKPPGTEALHNPYSPAEAYMPKQMEMQVANQDTTSQHEQPENAVVERPSIHTQRLVLLSVKTTATTFTNFFVTQDIIRESSDYSMQLDTAIAKTAKGGRLQITDRKIRRSEAMTQAIEYLTTGYLTPIDLSSQPKCMATLTQLLGLYDLSIYLSVRCLQHAIVEHIAQWEGVSPEMFVDFAAECYREGPASHNVKPECPLGKLIRNFLAAHLNLLVESGAVHVINQVGGRLSQQLVEVFVEDYVASHSLRAGKAEGGGSRG